MLVYIQAVKHTYRICYFGDHRNGKDVPFHGCSSEFQVAYVVNIAAATCESGRTSTLGYGTIVNKCVLMKLFVRFANLSIRQL